MHAPASGTSITLSKASAAPALQRRRRSSGGWRELEYTHQPSGLPGATLPQVNQGRDITGGLGIERLQSLMLYGWLVACGCGLRLGKTKQHDRDDVSCGDAEGADGDDDGGGNYYDG